MKKIGVIPNTYKDIKFEFTKEIVSWILEKNLVPLITNKISEEINMPSLGMDIKDIYKQADFLVVLGGDGTVLRVAKYAAFNNKPILGINIGTLGYLTDVEKEDCYLALEKVITGNYTLEKRMMLEVTSLNTDTENDNVIALNDVCLTRGFFSNMITIELFINDEYIDYYKADGIIVATPTGSTAYNLSAGGPILKPDGEIVAITPICPHMLHSRAFVVSAKDKITLKVINKKSTDVLLSMDGQNVIPIKDGDIINISKSCYYTTIIKTNKLGFYDILRKKMVDVGRNHEYEN